jgi:hypothetical protein
VRGRVSGSGAAPVDSRRQAEYGTQARLLPSHVEHDILGIDTTNSSVYHSVPQQQRSRAGSLVLTGESLSTDEASV